ncbi:RHS repeat-associated core domain-containing pro tein [Desulfonema ishimotonii]|uniref:RHS repeat-associated core domain-containing pro tein n=1 Tax=Desulfonema ishimotonii TaxID=45657 RepID=A0A401G2I9_9BACT|nr:RHS repeat-associated core domain-containing protein [Desulfonema ishimotonii]GBC63459.1 RHS repeat-associated core domain-containing pro tein [Desulfonema ishimotonii]
MYDITYKWDDEKDGQKTGRFSGLNWAAGVKNGVVAYSYVPDSDLLKTVTSGSLVTTYSYEPKRNLKTQVLNSWNGPSVVSQYDYRYDELGRRKFVENSGTAFAQTRHNIYAYNDRNELTGSERKAGTMAAPAAVVDAEGRLYEYDPIGNRISATEGSAATTYATDETNRYTALTGGVNASPLYDDDGNMTGYDGATYTWNAENRLIAAETADKRITFLYDYMGRRVRKQVYSGTPGSWNAVPDETRVFVYDGWNLIRETVSGTASGETYYVWGLDLSQSVQGAGGIGGLLCSVSGGEVRRYTYDANGNVGQLVDEAGAIVARYEYDPFGNEIRAEGDDAQNNPFRFSTKYLDAETGLYYYGFRYYSAEIGRWISRDPLEEYGGPNMFMFAGNDGINVWDNLGLFSSFCDTHFDKYERDLNRSFEYNRRAYLLQQTMKYFADDFLQAEGEWNNIEMLKNRWRKEDNVNERVINYRVKVYYNYYLTEKAEYYSRLGDIQANLELAGKSWESAMKHRGEWNTCRCNNSKGWYCMWGSGMIGASMAIAGMTSSATFALPAGAVAYVVAVANGYVSARVCGESSYEAGAQSFGAGSFGYIADAGGRSAEELKALANPKMLRWLSGVAKVAPYASTILGITDTAINLHSINWNDVFFAGSEKPNI